MLNIFTYRFNVLPGSFSAEGSVNIGIGSIFSILETDARDRKGARSKLVRKDLTLVERLVYSGVLCGQCSLIQKLAY